MVSDCKIFLGQEGTGTSEPFVCDTVKKMVADHCDALFWPVATVSGCTALLSLIVTILLVIVVRCVRSVVRIVSEVRPFASTLNKAITSGTQTSGGDDDLPPGAVAAAADELWAALGADAQAVVAVGLGWLASRW